MAMQVAWDSHAGGMGLYWCGLVWVGVGWCGLVWVGGERGV